MTSQEAHAITTELLHIKLNEHELVALAIVMDDGPDLFWDELINEIGCNPIAAAIFETS